MARCIFWILIGVIFITQQIQAQSGANPWVKPKHYKSQSVTFPNIAYNDTTLFCDYVDNYKMNTVRVTKYSGSLLKAYKVASIKTSSGKAKYESYASLNGKLYQIFSNYNSVKGSGGVMETYYQALNAKASPVGSPKLLSKVPHKQGYGYSVAFYYGLTFFSRIDFGRLLVSPNSKYAGVIGATSKTGKSNIIKAKVFSGDFKLDWEGEYKLSELDRDVDLESTTIGDDGNIYITGLKGVKKNDFTSCIVYKISKTGIKEYVVNLSKNGIKPTEASVHVLKDGTMILSGLYRNVTNKEKDRSNGVFFAEVSANGEFSVKTEEYDKAILNGLKVKEKTFAKGEGVVDCEVLYLMVLKDDSVILVFRQYIFGTNSTFTSNPRFARYSSKGKEIDMSK